jgi:hypothetical protein
MKLCPIYLVDRKINNYEKSIRIYIVGGLQMLINALGLGII